MHIAQEPFCFPDGTLVVDLAGMVVKLQTLSASEIASIKELVIEWFETQLKDPLVSAVLQNSDMPFELILTDLDYKNAPISEFAQAQMDLRVLLNVIQSQGFSIENSIVVLSAMLIKAPIFIDSHYVLPDLAKLEQIVRETNYDATLFVVDESEKDTFQGYIAHFHPTLAFSNQNREVIPSFSTILLALQNITFSDKITSFINTKVSTKYFKVYEPISMQQLLRTAISLHALNANRDYVLPADVLFGISAIHLPKLE